jgi:hypothetical protein
LCVCGGGEGVCAREDESVYMCVHKGQKENGCRWR